MELKTIDISQNDSWERARRIKQKELQRQRQENYQRAVRRKKRRRKVMAIKLFMTACMFCILFSLCFWLYSAIRHFGKTKADETKETFFSMEKEEIPESSYPGKPWITEDFLTPNPYSRPGEALPEVKNIFVHYTANKGTSAAQNRSYFENLGLTGETSASAHFVIGYDGEIIQCLPLTEIGYAVKERNYDSVSIECCYLDSDGKFTDDTYQSLIRLCGWLLNEYGLDVEDMRRHYDAGGKKCPIYYVEHEDAWEQFLDDLREYMSI